MLSPVVCGFSSQSIWKTVQKKEDGLMKSHMNGQRQVRRVALLEVVFLVGVSKVVVPSMIPSRYVDDIIMNRVVLVGELIPTSEQWSRIITAGGGRTVSVKNSITNGLRQFVKEEKEQTRLAVVSDKAKKTKLIQFLLEHHYICVSSGYVGIVPFKSFIAT